MAWTRELLFLVATITLVLAQGKSISELVGDLNKSNQNSQTDVDDKISKIWGNNPETTAATISTTAPGPNLQPSVGIPGTEGDCTCVPYHLCYNGTINKNGEGLIDIRINEGPCSSYLEVCCKNEDRVKEPIKPGPVPLKTVGCGFRNEDGVGFRITGGKDNEAQYGEFPWMVAVLKEQTVEGNDMKLEIYQCGGALIHPQVVLTAAHCVYNKKSTFKIRAGEWDTQTENERYPYQDRQVVKMEIHDEYYAGALYNDVALLFLDSPVTEAENIGVICLPPKDTISDGLRCQATGWGKDVFGKEGKYAVFLKKIDLPVVNRNTCQDKLRTTRLGSFFELHTSFICAGGEPGKDTCKGDGGSPLVCPIKGTQNQYYQAGIVAWGIGCGENNVPGVYVNVASFRDWIDEKMKLHNYNIDTYQY